MQQKDLEEKYRNWLLLNLRVSQFLYVSDQLFLPKTELSFETKSIPVGFLVLVFE